MSDKATVCVFSAAMAVALLLTLPFATAHACVAVAGMPCPVSGFRVFFQSNSAELTTQSWEVLVPTVARIQKQQPTTLRIIGYTDRSAEEESNQSLAERRVCAVASALIGLGIQGDRLEISAMPGIYRVPTRRGAAEPQNRHVEVILGDATDGRDTGATACGLPGVRSAPAASLAALSSEFQNTSAFAAFEIARQLFDTVRAAALDWFLLGKIVALDG